MNFDEILNLLRTESRNDHLGVCADSRLVKPGDIFVAVKGTEFDGHNFIKEAVAKGAKFVVCQEPQNFDDAEVILVESPAEALGILAQKSRDNPSSKLTNLSVTGTNGKTTVGFLVRSVINTSGEKCGLVGTVMCDTGLGSTEAVMTTPDATAISKMQEQMVENGVKYLVIEASSHGLSQDRLAGIDFAAAAFTNLSSEHLDYHRDMADYLAAKTRLFERLAPSATAILNKQSAPAKKIAKATKANILWYAVDDDADITARIKSMDIKGTVFSLDCRGESQIVETPLLGVHNVSNHLAAAGLCIAAGFGLKTVATGLSALKTIPGRLEGVDYGQDFSILIDYAHTDDALKNVLKTLRPLCKNRLTVVFGCGGDRDRMKRPRMAKVAEKLADRVIVTSDNPRTETPEKIIDDIVAGLDSPNSPEIQIETDRKKAIESAVAAAKKDDIILIAGKGHETYQIVGKKKFDFNDKAIVQDFLEKS